MKPGFPPRYAAGLTDMPGINTPPRPKPKKKITGAPKVVPTEFTTLRRFRNINDPLMRLASRTPVIYDPSVGGGGYTYANDPNIYLGTPNDFPVYLHELGHRGATLPGVTDTPNFWPEFTRAADALSRSKAHRGLPNSMTSNPNIPYPFRLPVTARYAPGARMSTTFPGIGDNPMQGIGTPNVWGGPGEFFAQLLTQAFGSRDRIPPPMRRFYRNLVGSFSQTPPFFGAPPTRDDQGDY